MFLPIPIILGHSWGSLLPRHCSSWWGYKTFKVELRTIFTRIIHFYFTFIDFSLRNFRQKVPSAATLQLHSFQFDDFSLKDNDMLKVRKNIFVKQYLRNLHH